MKEELITFETAKLAKEKGCKLKLFGKGFEYIDEDGNQYWTSIEKGISGKENTKPVIKCRQSLLQKWLREDRSISIVVDDFIANGRIRYDQKVKPLGSQDVDFCDEPYETYEEALEDALKIALKLIKNE
jgi:hypothetical protein